MRLQLSCWLEMQSSHDLTGAGGPSSKLTPTALGWPQFLVDTSLSGHLCLSIGLPTTWQPASSRTGDLSEREPECL